MYIASSIKSNVRELEGALIRLVAYASLSKRHIDLEFSQETLVRLYRGLKNRYRPERVDTGRFSGTDFTDCPAIALLYAQSPRGVVLVADLDDDEATTPHQICAASWPEREAQRFILWGALTDDARRRICNHWFVLRPESYGTSQPKVVPAV